MPYLELSVDLIRALLTGCICHFFFMELGCLILTYTVLFQALITKHTFSLLPPSYQYKLICLMPECDKIVGKDGALRYVKRAIFLSSAPKLLV